LYLIWFQIYRFFFAAFELSRVVDAPQEPVLGAVWNKFQ
jgi:hypothetical protein